MDATDLMMESAGFTSGLHFVTADSQSAPWILRYVEGYVAFSDGLSKLNSLPTPPASRLAILSLPAF